MATYPSLPGFAPTQDLEVPLPIFHLIFLVQPLQKSLPQKTRREKKLSKFSTFSHLKHSLERT